MLKVRLVVASLGLAMILSASSALLAQTASNVPAAPLPSQILTAKKVFISNAGVGTDSAYNEFYAAIKSWGRYELVAAPADADLVLEISLSSQITGVSGTKESGCDSSSASWFKLALLDTKTRIVLWTVTETIQPFIRQKTGEKNLDDAINKLVGDLKDLTAQPATTAKQP
jgi:hypothetical protein